MSACKHQLQREARVRCQKMNVGYCQQCLDDCMDCTDPCGYCQHRSGCIIWELCRRSPQKREMEELARRGAVGSQPTPLPGRARSGPCRPGRHNLLDSDTRPWSNGRVSLPEHTRLAAPWGC